MFSQFKPISFMGVSNPEMFLSEKDLNSVEFNFLVRPALKFEDECDIAPLRGGDDQDDELHDLKGQQEEEEAEEEEEEREQEEHKEEDKFKSLVSTLKIKLPSLGEFKIEEDVDDGVKTPTSLDHRIPVILPCPTAPRKPKSLPSNKRKSPRRRVLLDLSNEIESLFPPALRADLGGKIKKVRQENDTK
ncbi:hypothetical protein P3X46_000480 [Hevea brasiliensis]|uniref:Cyclin-dependent protein kinase inhibitor SMR3-like n=1 Tax=Hevea brasiliensis TaxID=3981 RepID=A0ABQ9NB38_HEVBR|nr:cyclin-dependent protein kinase inhibitor SMR10-like [Hevea brasiliensis]KAJ9189150.1 hypothetical protein P3X46_000480 [Hevea brasiliensis]